MALRILIGAFITISQLLVDVNAGKPYYGKWIGSFNTYAHKVSGKVYAVDDDTIFIKDFSYDGLGPDAFFWVGKSGDPSPNGVIVPYPDDDYGSNDPRVLRDFNKEDVILHLPSGYKLKDIAWISVWCRRFTVNFGDLKIPSSLSPPRRKVLPEFKRLAHGLRSGNITILDSRTFYIPGLHYDGAGPDAYFWVGTGSEPNSGGRKIPNEKGSLDVLQGYEGEDIEIQLPEDLTVYDIDYLAVWCVAYKHNFGHVRIPRNNLDVPPSLDRFRVNPYISHWSTPVPTLHTTHTHTTQKISKPKTDTLHNCRDMLEKKVQVQWERDGEYVKFRLSGHISETEWVALGFSPVTGRTQMVGADAVVVYYTPNRRDKFHADDYFMTAKSQCDGKDGVCPDARIGGRNDVQVISGSRKDGWTTVLFKRKIQASESGYDMSLTDEVNIFVAIEALNSRNEAKYHFGQRTGPSEDIRINVKSSRRQHSCIADPAPLPDSSGSKIKPWPQHIIQGVQNFTARIGPTGGKRGYTAITGMPSWGIAWYINDLLIPEIYVERGKTYYFSVEGGNDPKNPSKYHPLYITDSSEGGFGQKSEYEQQRQKYFAGVGQDDGGYPFPSAAGRYCEWEHKTTDKSMQSETFEDYKKTLQLVCDDGESAVLELKVPLDAPETLYYQCYTHNNLGWKIHVEDAESRLKRTAAGANSTSSSILLLLISILIVTVLQK